MYYLVIHIFVIDKSRISFCHKQSIFLADAGYILIYDFVNSIHPGVFYVISDHHMWHKCLKNTQGFSSWCRTHVKHDVTRLQI